MRRADHDGLSIVVVALVVTSCSEHCSLSAKAIFKFSSSCVHRYDKGILFVAVFQAKVSRQLSCRALRS